MKLALERQLRRLSAYNAKCWTTTARLLQLRHCCVHGLKDCALFAVPCAVVQRVPRVLEAWFSIPARLQLLHLVRVSILPCACAIPPSWTSKHSDASQLVCACNNLHLLRVLLTSAPSFLAPSRKAPTSEDVNHRLKEPALVAS